VKSGVSAKRRVLSRILHRAGDGLQTRRLQSAGRSRLGRALCALLLHGLEFLSRVQPSEGLLESQCPFMTGCSILRPKFLMSVGMKTKFCDSKRFPDLSHPPVQASCEPHSIELSIGNLVEVISVCANPYTLAEVVRSVALKCMACRLCESRLCAYWRIVVYRVPWVVNAPTRFYPFLRKDGD